ncbi:MAG: hypothetical protein FWE67_10190 [Planctomycetaceae bacterium]|nr:hypothetical protein [Planctomycetaceae bacterium]
MDDFDPLELNYVHITSTTYGTWLPGDKRGFVSRLPSGEIHNVVGTEYAQDIPSMRQSAVAKMTAPPVFLTPEHAKILLEEWKATAAISNWELCAVSVMSNHFHIAAITPKRFVKADMLRIIKANGSKALNLHFCAAQYESPVITGENGGLSPAARNDTAILASSDNCRRKWWTSSGSVRFANDKRHFESIIRYVTNQENPLLIWENTSSGG